MTVKGNQPHLFAQLKTLPWRQIPIAHESRGRGHGRDEHRTIKITSVAAGLLFPHAAQAIPIRRRRRPAGTKKWSAETRYAITSLVLTARLSGHQFIINANPLPSPLPPCPPLLPPPDAAPPPLPP